MGTVRNLDERLIRVNIRRMPILTSSRKTPEAVEAIMDIQVLYDRPGNSVEVRSIIHGKITVPQMTAYIQRMKDQLADAVIEAK